MAYFAFFAVWGDRGILALESTQAKLGVSQAHLAQLEENSARLGHRIRLMEQQDPDPDLIEELARGKLMIAAPHQAAMTRDSAQ